jgi:hypothetical protein
MFTEGVVSDDTGKVILNLMQQDAVAMRMVMRLAYATVNPVTVMNPGRPMTSRWPFGAILGKGATPPTQGPINVIGTYPGGTLLSTGEGEPVPEIHQGSQWEEEARERQIEALATGGRNIHEEGSADPVEERQTADELRETTERHQNKERQSSSERPRRSTHAPRSTDKTED